MLVKPNLWTIKSLSATRVHNIKWLRNFFAIFQKNIFYLDFQEMWTNFDLKLLEEVFITLYTISFQVKSLKDFSERIEFATKNSQATLYL